MPSLTRIDTPALQALEQATFGGLGCVEHGLIVLTGAESWGAHERGHIQLPTAGGATTIPLAYDERQAPYALAADGTEDKGLLLSLTDEGEHIACLWARIEPGSPLRGVGVDLSDLGHFRERPPRRPDQPRRDLARLLFTKRERELIDVLEPQDDLLAKATLFASKEAAFKATAAPLRRWYEQQDEELRYEVRHFVMEEPGLERGSGRDGAAQVAMERMGITRVVVRSAQVLDMALVTAVALADA